MHRFLVLAHRWVGLATAVFLFIAGITGAMIAWEHELDCLLNPQIFHARSAQAPNAKVKTLFELIEIVERENPHLKVGYVPLDFGTGQTAIMYVEGRIDPAT